MSIIKTPTEPSKISDREFRFDSFANNKVVLGKKKNHLPAMGWNSWNAFGSGNSEALTKMMADKMVELGLDKLGYEFLVLDDGCYKSERVEGLLSNEEVKFPSGFKALADYIHAKGLKFGMYNDIGTNLCAGALVGTCGYEEDDAKSYVDWDVDFLKVDNCYYLWDNATFSDAKNARYVFAPNIKALKLTGEGFEKTFQAKEGVITGSIGKLSEDYATFLGTYDGTGPGPSPVDVRSSELVFTLTAPQSGEYIINVEYATGTEEGVGQWLQAAVGEEVYYDYFLEATETTTDFRWSDNIKIKLSEGENRLRIMNHRRQENTLDSYAALLRGLNKAKPDHDIILSLCEWGKTHPQNWGYKVADSWRILNDITFAVGSDGNPGGGKWTDDYTPSVTSQYNKAVIMDEFAGLSKGWNDPDMMMIGMNGLTPAMNRTHMAMWCIMNSPLMLGLDLRRVQKGDELYKIIANADLIALNQDALGIQGKRIFSTLSTGQPDKEYIRNNDRVDVIAKPLKDGSVALSFINVSEELKKDGYSVDIKLITDALKDKMVNPDRFIASKKYKVKNLWDGSESTNETGVFSVDSLEACDNYTIKVSCND